MSLSKRLPVIGVFFQKAIILASCLFLTGCLQPMYGMKVNGNNLDTELQAIYVNPIPDRVGHYLSNELIFALNGTGSSVPPRYQLSVTVRERVQTPLVGSVTGLAAAATVVTDADFTLLRMSDEAIISKGTATSAAGYDRSSQRFANLRAARDAEIRTAKALADQIRTRISAAVATGQIVTVKDLKPSEE